MNRRDFIASLAQIVITGVVGCRSSRSGDKGFRYNYPADIASECWGARNNAFACIERVTGRKVVEQGKSLTVYKIDGQWLKNGRWAWIHTFRDGRQLEVSGLYDEPRDGEHVIFIGVDPATGKLGPQSTVDLMHEHGHVGCVWAGLGREHPPELRECFRNWQDYKA